MKRLNTLLSCVVLGMTLLLVSSIASADSVPELLHYRFDGTGTSVPNHAGSPPAGAEVATIMGNLTQDGADLNFLGNGHSLVGNGESSNGHYVDTHWETNLTGTSWTLSFVTENVPSTTLTYYIFGDINAGQFRCFTGGVAGAGNWILRGAFGDVYANGGAATARTRTTFVYDMPMNEIRAYVNGALVSTVPQTMVAITGIGPFKVGAYATSANLPLGSLLDDFRLYNRALTLAEIQAIDTHARIEVSGDSQPIANGDTTPAAADLTDFGSLALGSDIVHTFDVVNAGNLDLDIDSIGISGPAAADFSVENAPAGPIAPTLASTFQIRFDPAAAGLREAVVTVASNSGIDAPYVFSIQGTGTGPAIAVSGNGQPIANGDITPDAADDTDFGDVLVGAAQIHTFTIQNTGSTDLAIASIQLSGSEAGDYVVLDLPAAPIAPAASGIFQVQFEPGATGPRAAMLTIASNAGLDSSYEFALQGNGVVPVIALSGNGQAIANGDTTPDAADDTDFGTLQVNTGAFAHTFTIRNDGLADLTLAGIVIDGPGAAGFVLSQVPSSPVVPGGSTTFDVTFAPVATGTQLATVTVNSSDPATPAYTFDIAGYGEGADVQVSKTNLQPHVRDGVDTVYTIQVLNAGPAAVAGVHVLDVLPANLGGGAWQCSSTPSGLCPNASGGPNIDETTGLLPVDALLEYTLVATPAGAPSEFVSNTVAVLNLDGNDPDSANDTATDTDPIVPHGIFTDGFEATGARLLRSPGGSD